MTVTDQFLTRLRDRAVGGDAVAARELGRLLNLLPEDPASTEGGHPGAGFGCPGEPWLRGAFAARPDDTTAAL